MVSQMLVSELKKSKEKTIIFYIGSFRFEGVIKDFDEVYLKYYDTKKLSIKFKKLSEITEWEIK